MSTPKERGKKLVIIHFGSCKLHNWGNTIPGPFPLEFDENSFFVKRSSLPSIHAGDVLVDVLRDNVFWRCDTARPLEQSRLSDVRKSTHFIYALEDDYVWKYLSI